MGLVSGEQVLRQAAPALERPADAQSVIAQMVSAGRTLAGAESVSAVGVAVKGIVAAREGRVVEVNEPLRSLSGVHLAAELGGAFGVPAAIENDARLFAYGELLRGAGRGVANLVGVTLGTGVGVGVALEGELLSGERGVLGILGGHLSIDWQGPSCDCGSRGCLELYVGAPGLVAFVDGRLGEGAPSHLRPGSEPAAIFAAAETGDPLAEEALERFTGALATGLVNLVHAYDPDLIVLGGGLALSAPVFLDSVRSQVEEHAWTVPKGRVRIEVSQLAERAALLGAAALAESLA